MRQSEPLCQSYDPFRKHPGIYHKNFLPGRVPVSLRPFFIAEDLPLVNKWFGNEFKSAGMNAYDDYRYTEDYYTTLLAGNNSQPFFGKINHAPAFQADIYDSHLGPDGLLEAGKYNNHDFVMQLMMSPDTARHTLLSLCVLLACLDCFFRYEEVDRVIWMMNKTESDFCFMAGIATMEEIETADPYQSFYIVSKDKFRQVQASLPLFPEESEMAMDY